MADKAKTMQQAKPKRKEDELEEGLEESFPASDPPSEVQPSSGSDQSTAQPFKEESEGSETAMNQAYPHGLQDQDRHKDERKKTQRTE